MGSKRSAEAGGEHPSSKRRRDNVSFRSGASAVDQTYGQRGAFGNLQDATTTAPTGDSDLDCEDDADALAYLRSVRVQASAIPHVLAAKKAGPPLPKPTVTQTSTPPTAADDAEIKVEDDSEEHIDRSIYYDGTGDFRGYYHDGAYIAYPAGYGDEEVADDGDEEDYGEGEGGEDATGLDYDEEYSPDSSEEGPRNSSSDEIRDAYFAALTRQYLRLRQVLQAEPPDSATSTLPASNPYYVGEFSKTSSTFTKWSGRLRGTDPLPVQVAGMHKDGVIRLIRIILGGKFLRKNQELRERTSRWIWALLARLPNKGELDYQEVGWIRELGKRAVLLMVSLAQLEVLKEHYDVPDGSSNGSQDEAEMDVEAGVDEELDDFIHKADDYDSDAMETTADDAKGTGLLPNDGKNKETEIFSVVKDEDADASDGDGATALTGDPMKPARPSKVNGISLNAAQSNVQETKKADPEPSAPVLAPGDSSDVEMQIDSDMEDGEVPDTPPPPQAKAAADIEMAKARLLAQLGTGNDDNGNATTDVAAKTTTAQGQEEEVVVEPTPTEEEKAEEEATRAAQRARMNERATLNMILTVAGEFYGQRDLLEFRDPFGALL